MCKILFLYVLNIIKMNKKTLFYQPILWNDMIREIKSACLNAKKKHTINIICSKLKIIITVPVSIITLFRLVIV